MQKILGKAAQTATGVVHRIRIIGNHESQDKSPAISQAIFVPVNYIPWVTPFIVVHVKATKIKKCCFQDFKSQYMLFYTQQTSLIFNCDTGRQ